MTGDNEARIEFGGGSTTARKWVTHRKGQRRITSELLADDQIGEATRHPISEEPGLGPASRTNKKKSGELEEYTRRGADHHVTAAKLCGNKKKNSKMKGR